MACRNCDQRKDQAHIERLAEMASRVTGEEYQIYVTTTYEGEIFDFEPLGIRRENVIKITRLQDGKYLAISIPEQ